MKRRDDSNQLLIDWTTPAPATYGGDASPRKGEEAPCGTGGLPDEGAASTSPPPDPLIQRLPWDFRTTFPQPTDEAIEEGKLDESDREPENLRSLHENYAQQCLATLKQLDIVTDARRRGIDPATGKKPRTHATRERLKQFFDREPERLARQFDNLIGVYEDAFGAEAADAFTKAIRALHAGVDVTAERTLNHGGNVPDMCAITPRPLVSAVATDVPETDFGNIGSPKAGRLSSALPVPKPLASSVARGIFGQEENGRPVKPSPQEIRDITETAAEKMIDMLRERKDEPFRTAVAKYAEDFGEKAASQLEAYTRRRHREERGR